MKALLRLREGRRGAVLLLALALSALAAAIAVEIAYRVRVEGESAAGIAERHAALRAARNGTELALAMLERDDRMIDSPLDLWSKPLEHSSEAGSFRVVITDEAARFPINALQTVDGLLDVGWKTRFDRLAVNARLPENLSACLVDYMDPDDNFFLEGGEREYYERLDPPRQPANRKLLELDELRLVKGMSDSIAAGLTEISTLLRTRVNINTANALVISSLLPSITLEDAERIVSRRTFAPYKSLSELNDAAPISAADMSSLASYATVSSNLFRIESRGKRGRCEAVIVTIVERSDADFTIKYRKIL